MENPLSIWSWSSSKIAEQPSNLCIHNQVDHMSVGHHYLRELHILLIFHVIRLAVESLSIIIMISTMVA